MRYTPTPVPNDAPRGLKAWIARELRQIAAALTTADEITLQPAAAEPARPRDGMIAYANGVDWDPGSGAGVYAREAGAWVKL